MLHKLASLLREAGETCQLWHWTRVHPHERRLINGKIATNFATSSKLANPVGECPFALETASNPDIGNSCVIYPEIVEGNPLGARNIVRWLLNKPGEITGQVAFGLNELWFHYATHFLPGNTQVDHEKELKIFHFPHHIYYQKNFAMRQGTCHLIRKGNNRPLTAHPPDSISIDGMTHTQIAEIFNTCEVFISYDLHTAYSAFATVCGCDSIIIPDPNVPLDKWKGSESKHEMDGIAYDWDDLPRAKATRQALISRLASVELENRRQVKRFIRVTSDYFTNP